MSLTSRLINSMPAWLLGLIIVGSSILICSALVYAVRRKWQFDALKKNNEVAGFKYAVLGVLYAVVLAGALISVWEGYAEAREIANREADDMVQLSQLATAFPTATKLELRTQLHTYAESVINKEWDEMAKGGFSLESRRELDGLFKVYAKIKPRDDAETQFLTSSLDQLDIISDSRRSRILKSQEGLPGVMWAVLLIGAVFTLAFTYLFGTENVKAQAVMTALLAGTMSLALFVILCLDQPFSGDTRVEPTALKRALDYMHANEAAEQTPVQ